MAVDVGNTQTVLGLFEGVELRGQWRISTEAQRTSDELAVVSAGLLDLNGLELGQVSAMIFSSVVPGLTRSYRHLAEDVLGVPFYLVNAEIETGLKNRYDDPAAVGADRIVNTVATGEHYGFPAIIVDIGTATTVEAVDGEGCYLGGAIFTGLYVALEALVARTAKLPGVDLEEEPPSAIATNTPDSIRSGFVYGYAGAIDALVRRMREELGQEDIRIVATGGPAGVIVRHCREIEEFDPNLTLKGLRVLYGMNS
ncbi:MAG TPA: type III pantothenate kinase [Rubrobacteraceae bacterium]|nr:type III pantothenate kinase [Rubrobacteraceae bacterium]